MDFHHQVIAHAGRTQPIRRGVTPPRLIGRLVRSRKQDGNGGVKLRTEHIYDAYNRLSSQSWVLGTKAYFESYAYSDGENGDGSITRMTTATGATIDYTYDTLKRLQQTMVKDASGTPLLTTAYAYRNVNEQQTTAQIEFRNVRLGENGSVLEGKKYTYDALGNITEISQSAYPYNVLVKYEYDAQNQLVSEVYYDGSGSATANITVAYYYTYDTAGNLLQVEKGTVHAGVLIRSVHQTYTYSTGDWKDLLESVTTDGTACSITYDGSGNPTAYGNWAFSWQNGRQLFEAQADTDTTHTGLSYAYDAEGIRTSKTCTVETWEDIPQYTVTFVADGTTVKTMTVDDGYVLQNSDYPAVPPKTGYTGAWNRYTSAIHSNITIQATYTVAATYTVKFVARGLTVKTMTVNDGYVLKSSDYPEVPPRVGYAGRWNRYTSPIHSDITITAIYTQDGGIEIPIDPTLPPVIMSLEDGDAAASVGEQEAPAGVQETAALSGDRTGQRLVSTQTVQHDYLTLGGRVARETITTDGTVTAILDFIYDSQGRPFALNYSTNGGSSFTTYYYVLNLQGDVVKLISYIPGFEYEEVASYTYDAWGNIISSSGTMADLNPLRYRGYIYDTETGFYYLQSRYYDPANHRFINADALASTGQGFVGTNMLAYCNNEPILHCDSSGHSARPSTVSICDGGNALSRDINSVIVLSNADEDWMITSKTMGDTLANVVHAPPSYVYAVTNDSFSVAWDRFSGNYVIIHTHGSPNGLYGTELSQEIDSLSSLSRKDNITCVIITACSTAGSNGGAANVGQILSTKISPNGFVVCSTTTVSGADRYFTATESGTWNVYQNGSLLVTLPCETISMGIGYLFYLLGR